MPIHNPNEYPAIIARLKTKLAEKSVVMGPTLDEAEIEAFEIACNTRLPEAYRLFLQQVGDGCEDTVQPNGVRVYGLKRLADTAVKDLSHTVTINDYWLWEEEEDETLLTDEAFDERLGNQECSYWTKAAAILTSSSRQVNGPAKYGTSATWARVHAVSARIS